MANNKNKFNSLVIAGDFNFPYVEWDSFGTATVKGPSHSPGANFIKLLDDEHMTQNVTEPTFKPANGDPQNFLDYVIIDTPERISNILNGPPLGLESKF